MLNALIDYRIELNLWIALSILTYAISVNLAWRWRRPRPGRLASWIEKVKSWPPCWLAPSVAPLCLLCGAAFLPFAEWGRSGTIPETIPGLWHSPRLFDAGSTVAQSHGVGWSNHFRMVRRDRHGGSSRFGSFLFDGLRLVVLYPLRQDNSMETGNFTGPRSKRWRASRHGLTSSNPSLVGHPVGSNLCGDALGFLSCWSDRSPGQLLRWYLPWFPDPQLGMVDEPSLASRLGPSRAKARRCATLEPSFRHDDHISLHPKPLARHTPSLGY